VRDAADTFAFSGFWKLARKYWATGLEECYRSWSKAAFVRALQRLIPEVRSQDLAPAPAGVRAQALTAEGTLVDDFDIVQSAHAVHVRNVPSPAATASISIGRRIAGMALAASESQRCQALFKAGKVPGTF
jgi:L-2-hydroxyglutarate oxidase